jgi:hypothetical protein
MPKRQRRGLAIRACRSSKSDVFDQTGRSRPGLRRAELLLLSGSWLLEAIFAARS